MTVIKVENLSKRFYLGEKRPNSLRDAVARFLRNPRLPEKAVELWALRNVSFAVSEGETLGVIGHNGAGKSTLLKILSRITKPTTGLVKIRGRVGSLLEVGTGFHNELTGRENVFLNGAILGMKHVEIKKKFDEIVAFSEIERFLDTPIKHYSTGMYMRLAFSIAAHLDPEVLIVDEVLAVGDIKFQRKCLNKMRDVGRSGRTVIFVSHDMASVMRICDRGIALSQGEIVLEGPSADVVSGYLTSTWGMRTERSFEDDPKSPQSEYVRLSRVRMVDEKGETCSSFDIRHKIGIEAAYEVLKSGEILLPNYQLYNHERVHIFTIQDVASEWSRCQKEKGKYISTAWIPGNLLAEGSFTLNVAVVTYLPSMIVHFNALDVVGFDVFDPMTGDTARGDYAGKMEGVVRPLVEWETEKS
jgi:lipopolysaccharide transport system ATP-binding protein